MTDLMDLLDSAAGRPTAPTAQTVDGDVRRGRRALLRRRGARSAAVALTGAAAVAAALVIAGPSPAPGSQRVHAAADGGGASAQPSAGRSGSPGPAAPVGLVPSDPALSKDGPFAAALVPAGWRTQVSEFVLAFEPPGTDTTVNDFQNKLVVMLAGTVTPGPGARHLTVGGDAASTWTEGDTSTYYLVGPGGGARRPLVVQVPAALGWDDATLTRFAEGLEVSPGAKSAAG